MQVKEIKKEMTEDFDSLNRKLAWLYTELKHRMEDKDSEGVIRTATKIITVTTKIIEVEYWLAKLEGDA